MNIKKPQTNQPTDSQIEFSKVLSTIIDAITLIMFIITLALPIPLLIYAVYDLLFHQSLFSAVYILSSAGLLLIHYFIRKHLTT